MTSRLCDHPDELAALVAAASAALVADIDGHSRAAGFPSAPRPAGGYAESPAFATSGEVAEAVATGYRAATQLVYGAVPTIDEIRDRIRASAALL